MKVSWTYRTPLTDFTVANRAASCGFNQGFIIELSQDGLLTALSTGLLVHIMAGSLQNAEPFAQACTQFPALAAAYTQITQEVAAGNYWAKENVVCGAAALQEVAQSLAPAELRQFAADHSVFWPLLAKLSEALGFAPLVLRLSARGEFLQHEMEQPRGVIIPISLESNAYIYLFHEDFTRTDEGANRSAFPFIAAGTLAPIPGFRDCGPMQPAASSDLLRQAVRLLATLCDKAQPAGKDSDEASAFLRQLKKHLQSSVADSTAIELAQLLKGHSSKHCGFFPGELVDMPGCGHQVHRACLKGELPQKCPVCAVAKCLCCKRSLSVLNILWHDCEKAICAECILNKPYCPHCQVDLSDYAKKWASRRR